MRCPLELPPLIKPVLDLFDKYAPSGDHENETGMEAYHAAAELAYKMLDVDSAVALGTLMDYGPTPMRQLRGSDYGDLITLGLAVMVCDKGEPTTIAATVRGWALRKHGRRGGQRAETYAAVWQALHELPDESDEQARKKGVQAFDLALQAHVEACR